jgi:hypothetical protein
MASAAVQGRVHSCECEASDPQVVEPCAQPGIDGVALFTLNRKCQRRVIGSCRLLIGFLMARIALDGEAFKLSDGLALVTVDAIQSCVSSDQRKAILMLADRLENDAPSLYSVALLTSRSHLPAMKVGMAVRAVNSRVGENHFRVALSAGDVLMLPAQRILRLAVVIEFWNRPDRLPSHRRVAVLAGYAQVSVRATRNRLRAALPNGKQRNSAEQRTNCRCSQAKFRSCA